MVTLIPRIHQYCGIFHRSIRFKISAIKNVLLRSSTTYYPYPLTGLIVSVNTSCKDLKFAHMFKFDPRGSTGKW